MEECNKQVNIPKVDETQTGCEKCGYTNATCIILTKAFPYLSIQAGSDVEAAFEKVNKDLMKKGLLLTKLNYNYKPTVISDTSAVSYTIVTKDVTLLFKAGTTVTTATLPTAAGVNDGRELTFINHSGDALTVGTYKTGASTTATTIADNTTIKLKAIDGNWYKI